jgi:diguanylate cyclase (GGDEF)-like protein/PAS domain S-box-containing protein
MKLARRLMLIVTTSVALVALPCAGVAYYFMQQQTLKDTSVRLIQQTNMLMSMHTISPDGRLVENPMDFKRSFGLLFQSGGAYSGEQHFLLDQSKKLILAGHWQTQLENHPKQFAALMQTHPELKTLFSHVLTNQTQLLEPSFQIDASRFLVVAMHIASANWDYYRLVPIEKIIAPMRQLFVRMVAMVLLIGFLTGLLIEVAVRRKIVKRLEVLANAVRQYGSGDRNMRVVIEGDDEITRAERDFDEMADNIERLRHAESVLRAREQATLQSSLDGIHIFDVEGNLLEANPAFCKMLGYSHQALLTMNVADWDANKTRAELQVDFDLLIRENRTLLFETLHRCKDGSLLQVEINTAPMVLDGKPSIWASSRDITARKRAEETIRKSEERFRYMLETSPIAVRVAACSGRRVLFANQRYAKLINLPTEQVLGVNPINYYADPKDYEDVLAQLNAGNVVTDKLVKLNIPNSRTIWALASYLNLEYAGEDAVLGWFYDVTDLRHAERELRIAAQAFETQEGIVVTDERGVIIRVNNSFTQMTGYSVEEAVGKKIPALKSGLQQIDFYRNLLRLLLRNKFWQGEMWSKRKNGEVYPEWVTITAVLSEDGKTNNYVAIFSDITERKRTEQQIHQLAFYDPLTNLPNRRLLMDRLQQAFAVSARTGQHGALIFMDLDHFKTLNDTQGHDIGDLLLVEVAKRTSERVRQGDTVARLGGDEFVVVLERLSKNPQEAAAQAELVVEKIRSTLCEAYQLNEITHYSTPSIGIALFLGQQEKIDNLLKHADAAMYQAKAAGRNTIRFYDPTMQAALERRIAMEAELRLAVERGQFELFYQVQVDTQRRPVGVEVLLRWHHHERGLVSPTEFIPLAEETGLIVPIGRWALQAACAQLTLWQSHPLTRHLTLAVNVSAKQFRQTGFVAQMQQILKDSGANPALLKLELTESTVLADVEEAIGKMHELKSLGVTFSMDDFGTGYSSLSYLKRLPLDQIKIDQSFVRDIATDQNDAAIVQTIIAMSDALGLNVIAEGVETEVQLEFLELRGCQTFQGYLFSKPIPLRALEQLVGV